MTEKPDNRNDRGQTEPSERWPQDHRRLRRLIGDLCNGVLGEEDRERLLDRLRGEAAARRLYMDYMLVHVKLMERGRIDGYARSGELPEGTGYEGTGYPACESGVNGRLHRPRATPSRLAGAALAVAASVTIAAMAYQLHGPGAANKGQNDNRVATTAGGPAAGVSEPGTNLSPRTRRGAPQPENVAATGSNPGARPSPASDGLLYVAQITGLSPDTRWSDPTKSHEFLLRTRPNERLQFESGLIELEYCSGARIILQGPCDYIVTGPSSGRLIRGELTGHASIGDFTLSTPTAEVIDLGTAFGVVLDEEGNTDVCVLEGKVRVTDAASAVSPADSRLLEKGMAVRVEIGEGIKQLSSPGAERFRRMLPSRGWQGDTLSLVGVLSGVRNDRFLLAGVIAADTGESDRHPWLRFDGPGHSVSNGYQPTPWHPFIDGVFIPSPSGGPTAINSAGQLAPLPKSSGMTWGPVWSRFRLENEGDSVTQEDFWGTDTLEVVVDKLRECQTGMIGLHANVGITFDLAAIAGRWGKPPLEFRSLISNLDNSERRASAPQNRGRKFSASMRVYVDGELRDARLDFSRKDGEATIRADLRPGDRFLTLVSSDACEFLVDERDRKRRPDAFDHVVLIDPELSFEPGRQAR